MFNCFAKILSGNKQDNPTQAMLFGLFTFWTIPMHDTQVGWIPTQPTIVDPSSIRDRRVSLVDKFIFMISSVLSQTLTFKLESMV